MSANEADLTLDLADRDDGGVVITVAGEIDSSNCDRLQELLREQGAGGVPVAVDVDLAGVTFIDSSGLRALLVGQQAINAVDGSLRVMNPSDNVRRLFEITGLNDRLCPG